MQTAKMPISYSQISVFDGRLPSPFNGWKNAHVQQGFSWRQGSVSFKTLVHSGLATVIFELSQVFNAQAKSVRIIVVPFEVVPGSKIEIATIESSFPLNIAPGDYSLVYETGGDHEHLWIHFTFVADGGRNAKIILNDGELKPRKTLLMSASPA